MHQQLREVKRSAWCMAALAAAVVMFVPSSSAAALLPGRWASDVSELRIDLSGLDETADMSVDDWVAALTGAIGVWNDVADATNARVHLLTDDADPNIRIEITDSPIVNLGESPISWQGLCAFWNSDEHCNTATTVPYACEHGLCDAVLEGQPRTIDGAVIVINKSGAWRILDRPSNSDFRDAESMLIHELGHALGLAHSPARYLNSSCTAVMFGDDCKNVVYRGSDGKPHYGAFLRRGLAQDDICAFRSLYGTKCGGAARGVILDNNGPLQDAVVTVEGNDGAQQTARSDASGSYQFADVALGPATITASKDGFDESTTHLTIEDGAIGDAPTLTLLARQSSLAGVWKNFGGGEVVVEVSGSDVVMPYHRPFLCGVDGQRWFADEPHPQGLPQVDNIFVGKLGDDTIVGTDHVCDNSGYHAVPLTFNVQDDGRRLFGQYDAHDFPNSAFVLYRGDPPRPVRGTWDDGNGVQYKIDAAHSYFWIRRPQRLTCTRAGAVPVTDDAQLSRTIDPYLGAEFLAYGDVTPSGELSGVLFDCAPAGDTWRYRKVQITMSADNNTLEGTYLDGEVSELGKLRWERRAE